VNHEPPLDPDLEEALEAHPEAGRAFQALSPSHRIEHLKYINEARRPETRQRRIARTIETLESRT
jgi:uncharacterized protein YdeI (YjbR/CyaY-like superfamily)